MKLLLPIIFAILILMDFNSILAKIASLLNPKPVNAMASNPAVISPVSTLDEVTPGTQYGAQLDQALSADTTPSNFQPKTVQYPDWMANAPAQAVAGAQAPTPTPTPPPSGFAGVIQKALNSYGNVPVATASGALAKAGEHLPDPLLPAIISLIETHGGDKVTRGANNIFNMLPTRAGVDYPSLDTAILGGNGQKGFAGILNNPAYSNYRHSGNLADFFSVYSPSSENASLPDQIARYNSIRNQYFAPYLQ